MANPGTQLGPDSMAVFQHDDVDGEFNGHALFERYAGVLDSNLEQFVGVLAGHRAEMEAAQKVWRLLAGNYTGSACPDRTALTALTRFMNDGFKCPPREG